MQIDNFNQNMIPSIKISQANKDLAKLTKAIKIELNIIKTPIKPNERAEYQNRVKRLQRMQKETLDELTRLKQIKEILPDNKMKPLNIMFRGGIIQPIRYPAARDVDKYHWEYLSQFQPWDRIGESGQMEIRPNLTEGKVRLHYDEDHLISNVIDIGTVIKRQATSAKRQPYHFGREDREFIARCRGVAGRILRLTKPPIRNTTMFNMDGARVSIRVFRDRVARLPEHLGMDVEDIIDLCEDGQADDDDYIKMIEFCEPTIHLNPSGLRRELKDIGSGRRVVLRLGNPDRSVPESKQETKAETKEGDVLEEQAARRIRKQAARQRQERRKEQALQRKALQQEEAERRLREERLLAEERQAAEQAAEQAAKLTREALRREEEERERRERLAEEKLLAEERQAAEQAAEQAAKLTREALHREQVARQEEEATRLAAERQERKAEATKEEEERERQEEATEEEEEEEVIPVDLATSDSETDVEVNERQEEAEGKTYLFRNYVFENGTNKQTTYDGPIEVVDVKRTKYGGYYYGTIKKGGGSVKTRGEKHVFNTNGVKISREDKNKMREIPPKGQRVNTSPHTNNSSLSALITRIKGRGRGRGQGRRLAPDMPEPMSAVFDELGHGAVPAGELTAMLANMTDDWASSEDELNFAEESDTEEMQFAESSALEHNDSGALEFAESSAFETDSDHDIGSMKPSLGLDALEHNDSGALEIAESSAIKTDSGHDIASMKTSSGLEFAESSAVDSDSAKEHGSSSGLGWAESSDYD